MGIFSFFTRETELEESSAEQSSGQTESAPTGELFQGMRMDAVLEEGNHHLSGQIVQVTNNTLTLNRMPGDLSFQVFPLGAEIKLNGYDRKLIPIHLSGTVEESTRTIFKVKDVQLKRHEEIRDTFRLVYTAPVSLYRESDTRLLHPEPCDLVDISVGGCCVVSDLVHMEDEIVRIRIKLDEYVPLDFLGQIIRCSSEAQGRFKYGILFAQLTEKEITSLTKTLYNLQMGIKETHMRTEEGPWTGLPNPNPDKLRR